MSSILYKGILAKVTSYRGESDGEGDHYDGHRHEEEGHGPELHQPPDPGDGQAGGPLAAGALPRSGPGPGCGGVRDLTPGPAGPRAGRSPSGGRPAGVPGGAGGR